MPFTIVKKDGKYCLKNKDTGEIKAGRCHDTREKAVAQAVIINQAEAEKKRSSSS